MRFTIGFSRGSHLVPSRPLPSQLSTVRCPSSAACPASRNLNSSRRAPANDPSKMRVSTSNAIGYTHHYSRPHKIIYSPLSKVRFFGSGAAPPRHGGAVLPPPPPGSLALAPSEALAVDN